MKVAVVGLGYIGLPTAAVLAAHGVEVRGVDLNETTVRELATGRVHIAEPGLAELVAQAVASGHLSAGTKPQPADAFLIAVPTPFKDDHVPDISYVQAAVESLAPVLARGNTLIIESTSPVGTTEKMVERLRELRPDLRFPQRGVDDAAIDVHVAYCPERVIPGRTLHELVGNDRTIGGMTPACAQRAAAVYATFVSGRLIATDARTAELCKLAENSFRDVNIAFANELSLVCADLDIDVWELIGLANHHPRVNILRPGCGVGGHCIAVDPWFIVNGDPASARLIATARRVNDGKPKWVIERIRERLQGLRRPAHKPLVALLGITFKPDIEDMRHSPALEIATAICSDAGHATAIVEPNVTKLPAALSGAAHMDLETAMQRADLVVVLVAHRAFIAARDRLRAVPNVMDVTGALAEPR